MQVAASFIEYLIVGCITLFWILPLIPDKEKLLSKDSGYLVFLLLPVAYVLGMLIDYLSKGVVDLLSKPRKTVKKWSELLSRKWSPSKESESDNEPRRDWSETALVALHSTDLNKELQMRSSRDRIARGAFLNSLILFLLTASNLYYYPDSLISKFGRGYISLTLLIITIISYYMWRRFKGLTDRYKHNSILVIREKLAMENKKGK